MDVPKQELDKFIINFKNSMKLMEFDKIAIPTSVKNISKYYNKDGQMFNSYKTGTPVHVKSSIFYNEFLKYKNISNRYNPISNGEKIKWVYLKQNPLGLNTMAYKGHEDPIELLNFIRQYINHDKLYKQALHKKIMMLYESMNWDEPTDASKTIERFF